MATVYAPNKNYNGVSAGVAFADGKGETDSPHLLDWFRSKGYTVETADAYADELERLKLMDENALIAYAAEKDIDLGNASSQNGYLKKITEALKAGQA